MKGKSNKRMSTDAAAVYNLSVRFASRGLNLRREAIVCVSGRLYFLEKTICFVCFWFGLFYSKDKRSLSK